MTTNPLEDGKGAHPVPAHVEIRWTDMRPVSLT